MVQQVRKASVSSLHRPLAEAPSLGQRFRLAFQRYRLFAGIGVGGVVCILLVMIVVSAYWGERQRRGLRELQAGILAFQTGDMDNAASQLTLAEQHLTTEGARYLRQIARLNLGYVAERQGDLSQARQYYEVSAGMDGPAKAEALLATARILALMKDDAAADSYYTRFLEQYQDSPTAEIVRQKVKKE